MHAINWKPTDKTLREFAEFGMFIMGLVAAPYMLYEEKQTAAIVFWAAAIVLRVAALINPRWVYWPFIVLSVATFIPGLVISQLAMGLIYYLIFTPVALIFRLRGRDALRRKIDRQATSYWEAYNPNQGAARYLRQF